jgi:hypothetical protein
MLILQTSTLKKETQKKRNHTSELVYLQMPTLKQLTKPITYQNTDTMLTADNVKPKNS